MRTFQDIEANNAFEEAITLAREVIIEPPDHLPLGRTIYELSVFLWWYGGHFDNSDRLKHAEEMFNEAIQQWEIWANQVGDLQSHSERRMLAIYQLSLCNVWIRIGKLSEAESKLKNLFEDAQEPHMIGMCYVFLTGICQRMNRPFEALEWSEKAMNAYNQMPENIFAFLGAHTNFARVLHTLGRYSEALHKIEEVLRMARESWEKAPEIYSGTVTSRLRMQAVFLRQTGKTSDAEKINREVLRLLRNMTQSSPDVKNVAIAWTLNNRGVLHYKNDNLSKAERNFSEGLELGRGSAKRFPEVVDNVECIAVILNNLGNLYLTNGRIKEAR
ncbi:tetratricopeptide repeat protein, partial [bacterium]|nr:tetratricopeptide repeat protein [bacterium]